MSTRPSRRAEQLIAWSLTKRDRTAVLGDLQEEFLTTFETRGEHVANRWYWRQAITSFVPNVVRRARSVKRRRDLIFGGLSYVVLCGVMILMGSLGRRTVEYPLVFALWAVSGLAKVIRGTFGNPARPRSAEYGLATGVYIVAMIAVALLASATHPWGVWWTALVGMVGLEAFPWSPSPVRPPALQEFLVRRLSNSEDDASSWLTVSVPNTPLGLSGLILSHAGAAQSSAA
jgi:hypothetical protein